MQLNALFGDHMVLQANRPVRVFGTGDGEASVSFLGCTVRATVKDGGWLAQLPTFPYGGPYTMTVALDGRQLVLQDVWVGEVLLCAGQSNMQFTMAEERTPPQQYADDDRLRQFAADRPEEATEGARPLGAADGWQRCRADDVGRWSALGYLIGRQLRQRGAPAVGIVLCAQGASVIQSWMSPACLADPALQVPSEQLFIDHHHAVYGTWNAPGFLYDRMLLPLCPFVFGRVIWYQGESNTSPAEGKIYLELLQAMIENWRRVLADAALPFTVIQIADTRQNEGWLAVQAAQAAAPGTIAGVQTVVSGDISEKEMIHPVTKGLLAARVADAFWSKA